MNEQRSDAPNPSRTTGLALLFEGGLGLAALMIGWLVGRWPLPGLGAAAGDARSQFPAACYGLAATLPLLAALLIIDRAPIAALRRVREVTQIAIFQMFGGASVLQLAAVSLAAGWGEELLFRGLIQGELSHYLSPWIGLVLASILFGVCHWLNTTYAILAMLAGVYFGVIYLASDSLVTPMTAHAAYDFLALLYLVRPCHLLRLKPADQVPPTGDEAPQITDY